MSCSVCYGIGRCPVCSDEDDKGAMLECPFCEGTGYHVWDFTEVKYYDIYDDEGKDLTREEFLKLPVKNRGSECGYCFGEKELHEDQIDRIRYDLRTKNIITTMKRTIKYTTRVEQEKTYEIYPYFKLTPEISYFSATFYKADKDGEQFLRVHPEYGISIVSSAGLGSELSTSAIIEEINQEQYLVEYEKVMAKYEQIKTA